MVQHTEPITSKYCASDQAYTDEIYIGAKSSRGSTFMVAMRFAPSPVRQAPTKQLEAVASLPLLQVPRH
jgi:hypothetical protein